MVTTLTVNSTSTTGNTVDSTNGSWYFNIYYENETGLPIDPDDANGFTFKVNKEFAKNAIFDSNYGALNAGNYNAIFSTDETNGFVNITGGPADGFGTTLTFKVDFTKPSGIILGTDTWDSTNLEADIDDGSTMYGTADYSAPNLHYFYQINPIQYDQDLSNGLISYYNFEETSGTTVYDQVGSNNGTITGSSVIHDLSGKIGGCYNFLNAPWSGDAISTGISGTFNELSISIWVYLNNAYGKELIIFGTEQTGGIMKLRMMPTTGGNVAYVDFENVEVVGSINIKENVWNHCVMVYNGTNNTGQLYVNGVLDVNQTTGISGSITIPSSNDLYIGGVSNRTDLRMQGKLDEVGIWNRALSSTEVSKLYNNSKARYYK